MGVKAEAVEFPGNGGVPDAVKVRTLGAMAIKCDRDIVAATAEILSMQRLVDVANEMEKEFHCLIACPERRVLVQNESSLVLDEISSADRSAQQDWAYLIGDGRDYTALYLLAIAGKVQIAIIRRAVLRIYTAVKRVSKPSG